MIETGSQLTLQVEKATAGGRMLARHNGQVVLVWGAVPGERVRARVERAGKGVVYAETVDVLDCRGRPTQELGADEPFTASIPANSPTGIGNQGAAVDAASAQTSASAFMLSDQ